MSLPQPEVLPDEFVIEEASVERKLSQINVFKSPRPDGLPNWILRDFCAQLAGPVCAMFNASVRQGIVSKPTARTATGAASRRRLLSRKRPRLGGVEGDRRDPRSADNV